MLLLIYNLFVHAIDVIASFHNYQVQNYETGVGLISLGKIMMRPKTRKGLKSGRQPEYHKNGSKSKMSIVRDGLYYGV